MPLYLAYFMRSAVSGAPTTRVSHYLPFYLVWVDHRRSTLAAPTPIALRAGGNASALSGGRPRSTPARCTETKAKGRRARPLRPFSLPKRLPARGRVARPMTYRIFRLAAPNLADLEVAKRNRGPGFAFWNRNGRVQPVGE